MSAIHSAGGPAPAVIACSSDAVVDGRAFALMQRAPGAAWSDVVESLGSAALARATLTALGDIQRIDVSRLAVATELDTFSPAAEVDRWAALVPRTPTSLHPVMYRLRDALIESAPSQREVCLVHGDFHYGNVLFDRGRVTAVLDWEIASLGDPLVDVASLVVASHRRRYAPEPNPTGGLDVAPGMLADWSGTDSDRLAWFIAQSCFKYAAIIGYNLGLHRRGKRLDPIYEQLQRTMAGLPSDALTVLTGGIDAIAQTPLEPVSR
jgi:aminoglycoside phosphotransferase (APT) family kinase protein